MRLLAKTLLVLFVLAGLTLPRTYSRTHEVACDSAEACAASLPFDLADLLPADDCPLDEWPTDCNDCGGHEHEGDDHDAPLHSHHHGGDDGSECPHHQHHHHHQCVCIAANAWLISDNDRLSLHPPLQGHALIRAEFQIVPDSPVYLLERPPIA